MTEGVFESNEKSLLDLDLKNALLSVFGSDAIKWLDEGNDAPLSDDCSQSSLSASDLSVGITLESALDQLSSSLDEELLDRRRPNEVTARQFENASDTSIRCVVFQVGTQTFGVPLDGVQEIDRCGKVTVLPRTPDWLRGVTNLRGKIFSVTDFRKLLKLDDERPTTAEKIIVIQSKRFDAKTALVVDRVLGIRSLAARPESVTVLTGIIATVANGISIAQDDSIVLIDPDQLLGGIDLRNFAD